MYVTVSFEMIVCGETEQNTWGFAVKDFVADENLCQLSPYPDCKLDFDIEPVSLVEASDDGWEIMLVNGETMPCKPVFIPKFLQQFIPGKKS